MSILAQHVREDYAHDQEALKVRRETVMDALTALGLDPALTSLSQHSSPGRNTTAPEDRRASPLQEEAEEDDEHTDRPCHDTSASAETDPDSRHATTSVDSTWPDKTNDSHNESSDEPHKFDYGSENESSNEDASILWPAAEAEPQHLARVPLEHSDRGYALSRGKLRRASLHAKSQQSKSTDNVADLLKVVGRSTPMIDVIDVPEAHAPSFEPTPTDPDPSDGSEAGDTTDPPLQLAVHSITMDAMTVPPAKTERRVASAVRIQAWFRGAHWRRKHLDIQSMSLWDLKTPRAQAIEQFHEDNDRALKSFGLAGIKAVALVRTFADALDDVRGAWLTTPPASLQPITFNGFLEHTRRRHAVQTGFRKFCDKTTQAITLEEGHRLLRGHHDMIGYMPKQTEFLAAVSVVFRQPVDSMDAVATSHLDASVLMSRDMQLRTARSLESTWLQPRVDGQDSWALMEASRDETPLKAVVDMMMKEKYGAHAVALQALVDKHLDSSDEEEAD
ncbi:uncharacterized protein MONBRDRAFT_9675 [Monosiga brevicollis MX1]|uniref:Uncharacterized protein n=1 Tax=Monosiga brevicollis TaxID=81824 RepID=A9V416_MONBE|nr:uncharacterized protein MONBRDRAFT_9675 [Monosiga brevicollis MX1]EDQ87903.1 predicted protein [Monosiga brevicollis MX1]|eukprot:XP_001747436.1 hypothetical protein [Monosiga brevicollis MX1]